MATVTPRFGWSGRYNAEREWDRLSHLFVPFGIRGAVSSAGKRVVAWDAVRQLLGKDIPNIPQAIGDCVSWGCRGAADSTAIWEIVRQGQAEKYRPSFAPFFYGCSRVQVGGGRLGNGDGSLGSWGAEAMTKYGILPADESGVPAYSGGLAKNWGKSGPPKEFLTFASKYKFKSAARLKSYVEVRDAVCNGYFVTYASTRGHAMQLKYDAATKKHWHQGVDTWPHQRYINGVDDDPKRPGVFITNSWGPEAHGPQEDGPLGGGWFDADDFDKDARKSGTEVFAVSLFDGFPGESQKPNFLVV